MTEEKVKDEAIQLMSTFQILPKLVVFDLDFTLWPFYCEDRSRHERPSLYPQVKGIISALKEKGIEMAIASRSPTSDIANTFLDKLDITPMLVAKEIYSSWCYKAEHFQKIHTRTGVPFTEMLFFDDEDRNIEKVSKMGVTSVLVDDDGVTLGALEEGITEFSRNHINIEKNKQVWLNKYSGKSASSETDEED